MKKHFTECPWISIENAPKDGQKILVITDGGEYHVASWSLGKVFRPIVGWQAEYVWRTNSSSAALSATHYMPLPDPPRSGTQKE